MFPLLSKAATSLAAAVVAGAARRISWSPTRRGYASPADVALAKPSTPELSEVTFLLSP